ncbi:hypothetical protein DHEL01_v204153, partial [Diaporthe helianthi]
VQRTEGKAADTECNTGFLATDLIGSQRDFDYKAFTKASFVDEAAFQTFFGLHQQPDNTAQSARTTLEQFLDRSQSKLLVDPRGFKPVGTIRITGLRGYIIYDKSNYYYCYRTRAVSTIK